MNSRENSNPGDCGHFRVCSPSKNLLALLDPHKTLVELGNPHWSGRVIKASLLESSLRSVRADLLGSGRCAMIPAAEPAPVYCSSAREIQAHDLPVFKVHLDPKQGTQMLP